MSLRPDFNHAPTDPSELLAMLMANSVLAAPEDDEDEEEGDEDEDEDEEGDDEEEEGDEEDEEDEDEDEELSCLALT